MTRSILAGVSDFYRTEMSYADKFTDEQKAVIQGWADEGASLPDIQRRMETEMGTRITYMEARFLISDLGIKLKEDERPSLEKKPPEEPDSSLGEELEGGELESEDSPGEGAGAKVKVTIDELVRPGAVVSGKATFPDGETAEWHLDQFGRLGLNPLKEGYKPKESDVIAFQRELQRVAREKRLF